ncbi:MAG: hypothetical protein AB7T63_07010 [Planctomycetota bacterium]
MAGNGGYKQRKRRLERKRHQTESKARENIRRVRVQFEQRGQTWDPRNDGIQLAALNHSARRLVLQSPAV